MQADGRGTENGSVRCSMSKLYVQLTPISVDLAHQFPFIPPGGSAIGVTLVRASAILTT